VSTDGVAGRESAADRLPLGRLEDHATDLLDRLDAFLASTVAPLEARHAGLLEDPRQRFSAERGYSPAVVQLRQQVRMAAAQHGLYTLFAPAKLGGSEERMLLHYVVWEHLFHECGPDRLLPYDAVAHVWGGPSPALTKVSPELQRTVLPRLVSGEEVLCSAFTENDDGSGELATTARRVDEIWEINGTKCWVSRGPYADHILVYAVTDVDRARRQAGGVTAFLVPAASPGLTVEPATRLLGRVGGDDATIVFDHVRASDQQIIGSLHEAHKVTGAIAPLLTSFTAGRFVGLARWALEQAASHLRQRETTGSERAPSDTQLLELADGATEACAAHLMAQQAFQRLDAGHATEAELTMVRGFAVEMSARVHDRCMRIEGTVSLTSDHRLFDGWHQTRIVLLAGAGTLDGRLRLGRQIIDGALPFGGTNNPT
jgi:alkylation response protein AidB-like acyl-CoA dehydrogenase